MTALLGRFSADESGATAIEYGLITALVAVGCIVGFAAFGDELRALFQYVVDKSTEALRGTV